MQLNKDGTVNKFDKGRAQVRKHILDSSFQVISHNSLADVSMLSLADAAKVSRQTLYKYFPTMDDIILGIKNQIDESGVNAMLSIANDRNRKGKEALLAIGKAFFELSHQDPNRFTFLARFSNSPTASEMTAYYSQLFARTVSIEKIILAGQKDGSIRADIDPAVEAISLITDTIGLTMRLVTAKPKTTIDDRVLDYQAIEANFTDMVDVYLTPRK
jgi:AcrR family transcriptional regulator